MTVKSRPSRALIYFANFIFILQDGKLVAFTAKHWTFTLTWTLGLCRNKRFVISTWTWALVFLHCSTSGMNFLFMQVDQHSWHFLSFVQRRRENDVASTPRKQLVWDLDAGFLPNLQWGDWWEGGRWRAGLCLQWPPGTWAWFWRRWWRGRGPWCQDRHTSCPSSATWDKWSGRRWGNRSRADPNTPHLDSCCPPSPAGDGRSRWNICRDEKHRIVKSHFKFRDGSSGCMRTECLRGNSSGHSSSW